MRERTRKRGRNERANERERGGGLTGVIAVYLRERTVFIIPPSIHVEPSLELTHCVTVATTWGTSSAE